MTRHYNFSAGPAILPEAVLQQAQHDMLDWHQRGLSVMEMSHRGADFTAIAEKAESDLRQLLAIPDHYKVLFMQGGASAQFAMLPLNFLALGAKGKLQADYVSTGAWSNKAIKEAGRYGTINVVASSEDSGYKHIPDQNSWQYSDDAAYLHYTANETMGGVEYHFTPDVNVPLVTDMSSSILSRPVDIERFGLIYAGAQKNIGPAGLTLAIIREDLLGKALEQTPTVMDYAVYAKHGSMYNTPPTYAWYLAGLVFQWLIDQGGLQVMAERNQRKAEKLYAMIDGSSFYHNSIAVAARSWMNVPFILADSQLDQAFLTQAEAQGLINLKGHRDTGGMRASIYNAMPEAGVDRLIQFMKEFEQNA